MKVSFFPCIKMVVINSIETLKLRELIFHYFCMTISLEYMLLLQLVRSELFCTYWIKLITMYIVSWCCWLFEYLNTCLREKDRFINTNPEIQLYKSTKIYFELFHQYDQFVWALKGWLRFYLVMYIFGNIYTY